MKSAIAFIAAAATLANAAATPALVQERATSSSSGSLPVVSVQGNAFFAGGQRFYIRGVDYQPGGSSDPKDPIADVTGCKRDIAEFQKLGINTIRVYTVDNSANHDECMSALAAAGIYLALDVNTPKYSLNRANPGPSYNGAYLQSVFATIDAFAKYDNTLLFFSGNEVINDDTTTDCAPYVKAITRDMRQYIRNRSYRHIPVGYSAADVESNRYEMAQYMNCGTDDERSDFYAFNDYSWCDPSSFQTSGWDQKVAKFANYSIPLFLSEYGCNTNARTFGAVASIYSSDMSAVYSGGLVYEYSQEPSNYGLVTINSDGTVSELTDFQNLMAAYAKTPNPSGDGGYTSSGAASTCPGSSSSWQLKSFSGDALPAMPSGAKSYMTSGAGTGPGLSGAGSQDAGGASQGTATPGSGQPSTTSVATGSTGTPKSAASGITRPSEMVLAPFVCMGVVFFSTLLGASLL